MPERTPSQIRQSMATALNHPHMRLPPHVVEQLPEPARQNVASRLATVEADKAEKATIINRVGGKIAQLRAVIPAKWSAELFMQFRQDLYGMLEDDREAAVDAKIAELGA